MKHKGSIFKIDQWFLLFSMILLIFAGCGGEGSLTETVDTVQMRDLSGISGPPDTTQMAPVARVPRAIFGTVSSASALAYPGISSEEQAVFDHGLTFFITDRTPEDGLGPIFNQPICLGCHRNSDEAVAGLVVSSTPVSRAGRSGVTTAETFNTGVPPPTAAFTLFGDFFPAAGVFNPLAEFGGPIQHVRSTGGCLPDIVPPESIDPFLQGGIDPLTGLSALGGRRAMGERAAPPYIGRGLIEAIHAADIVANDDPNDTIGHTSSLPQSPASVGCPAGDCVSGRHNENRSDMAFTGGDPVIRVSRFGLRAAGPTLFQFMIGGTQGEIGLTSPFSPIEQNNNQNVGKNCDRSPDPEITSEDVLNLRAMIRLVSLPEFDPCLLFGNDGIQCTDATKAADIAAGADLFGVDLAVFRRKMDPALTPAVTDDAHAINQTDRKLNCVGCHTPVMRTGQSPAAVGAQHLSNKFIPIFSDLLLHDMGQVPQGLNNPVPPSGATPELNRNLADFALPFQGLASGREWRTPPLMGIGRIGPPFMHDARVFLDNVAPLNFATTVMGATNAPLIVDSFDNAILASIELHDLPPPAAGCPQAGAVPNDTCPSATSGNRSEARNVIARWQALSTADRLKVVEFLKAL